MGTPHRPPLRKRAPAAHDADAPREPRWWVCWDCGRVFKSEPEAIGHCDALDHELAEHPNGFRGRPATRAMYAGSLSGVHVEDLPPTLAVQMADWWRNRERRD